MAARYILAVLALAFLLAALFRISRPGGTSQARAWLIVAAFFGAVSIWLFARG
jgi:hypothetical protein